MGHSVSSLRERKKRDRRAGRGRESRKRIRMKEKVNTVINLSIRAPYLLIILVLKFEIVHSTTS